MKRRPDSIPAVLQSPHYEDAEWYEKIRRDSDLYRRRFLNVSLAIGLLLPFSVAMESLRLGEYWNLPTLIVAEISLVIALIASFKVAPRGLDQLCAIVLAIFPLAYLLNVQSAGSHQTYVIVLLCMPLIFDALSPPRQYRFWLSYVVAVVVVAGLLFLAGVPSMWAKDFSLGGTLTIHASFFVLWVMRYVTSRQMRYYTDKLVAHIISDPATGLPSIVALREALRCDGTRLLCIVTIGNFRQLSAIFGYSFAENVLMAAAARLSAAAIALGGSAYKLRHNDFAFFRRMSAGDSADPVVAGLRHSMEGPLVLQDKTIELNCRIGYAVDSGGDVEKILDRANEAVKIAKEGGEVTAEYCWDSERVAAVAAAAADLVTLSRNVAEKSHALFYQPIIALAEDRVAWNEALVRFKGKDGGYIEPARLMKLAASTGHWASIEDFVLENAAKRSVGPCGAVSFNAGLMDLHRESFRSALEQAARSARDAGSALILELLEGDFGAADEKGLAAIRSFRAAGGLVAIDDFGTGYSNYARLSSSPVDIVKFDRALINLALVDKSIAKLIAGLAEFCSSRGALTVAEGIETEVCAEFVAAMGFDFGQGYYWSRPVPEQEARRAEMTVSLARRLARS